MTPAALTPSQAAAVSIAELQAALDAAIAERDAAIDRCCAAGDRLYRAKSIPMYRDLKARGIVKGTKVLVLGENFSELAYFIGVPAHGFGDPRPLLKTVLKSGKPGKSDLWWYPRVFSLEVAP